jgi:hypothetical protein
MHTIAEIDTEAFVAEPLVNLGRAKMLARIAILFGAARGANVGVRNHKVTRLVFFVNGTRVKNASEPIRLQIIIVVRSLNRNAAL